jgi:hypothetical protein
MNPWVDRSHRGRDHGQCDLAAETAHVGPHRGARKWCNCSVAEKRIYHTQREKHRAGFKRKISPHLLVVTA